MESTPTPISPVQPVENPGLQDLTEPDEEEEGVKLGTFVIVSEEFSPFTYGDNLEGLSIVAQISDGEHDTEYSVSFIRGLDADWTPGAYKPIPGSNNNGIEDDEALKQRLRDTVVSEANDPARAILMSHRFTS